MIINKIKIGDMEMIHLTPEEGMILNKEDVYSHSVYLGVNDVPENWNEIPEIEEEM